MKIAGARNEAVSRVRRAAEAELRARLVPPPASAERRPLQGLTEAELQSLLAELDDLREEVSQLKARLAEARGLADRDALTPLFNRRAFLRELQRAVAFARRYDAPTSLVFFDLDGFKQVNDRFGHAAGDAALQTVAERLAGNVRESDVVGRLGGDEFGVILIQADQAAAEAKARALAQAIEGEPLQVGDWAAPLRVSYGVRQLTAGMTPETLLAEADAAMYAHKRARRQAMMSGVR